jgi:hypothetical protein
MKKCGKAMIKYEVKAASEVRVWTNIACLNIDGAPPVGMYVYLSKKEFKEALEALPDGLIFFYRVDAKTKVLFVRVPLDPTSPTGY